MKVSPARLAQRQAWPLIEKIKWALYQIRLWYNYWDMRVYVSFSGGKDSTALLHLVRSMYPEVPAVFCNTGLEFPEIVQFVRDTPNVTWLHPGMTFKATIEKYGWPIISKDQACAISRYRNTKDPVQKYRRLNGWPNGTTGMIRKKYQYLIDAPFKISDACCDVMKKRPFVKYVKETGRHPIMGTMAQDSKRRKDQYQKHGCNMFSGKDPKSAPLSIWTDQDVWRYLKTIGVPYCDIYDKGYSRTGCAFCAFGILREEEPNRFQRMKQTHPKLWAYCMDKLGMRDVLSFISVPCE